MASGRLAQGFPSGGSVRLCGAEAVNVESHEDMAVRALDRAPPTDWPGRTGGEHKRETASLSLRDSERPMLINKCYVNAVRVY